MNKINYIIGLFFLFPICLLSQGLEIKGRIIDEKNKHPVEPANIALFTTDSVFVAGCVTDAKGFFVVDKIHNGNFYVNISYIGYETTTILLPNLLQDINLGDILIIPSDVILEEVEIAASSIINAKDRFIAYPTDQQKKRLRMV